jgi:hypothetical protein
MTNELDRAIATINRHLLYSKLCTVFIQNGNAKSCLQMLGIDLDNADEEPTQEMDTELLQPSETPLPSPDNTGTLETNERTHQLEPAPLETNKEPQTSEETTSPPVEKPKRRGRKKKEEVPRNDEFDEAYKKAYSEAMKDDKDGQTNG